MTASVLCHPEPVGYLLVNPGVKPVFVTPEEFQQIEYRFRALYTPVYLRKEDV
jgi:hypothetical protein